LNAVGQPADGQFRIYNAEVVELNREVAMLLLLPAQADFMQSTEGSHSELLATPGPVAATSTTAAASLVPVMQREFEHMCWRAYQPVLYTAYARLDVYLAMRVALCRHDFRNSMSSEETARTKKILEIVTQLHSQLADSWGGLQWLVSAVQWGRKGDNSGFSLEVRLYSSSIF
jgi:hypothetical protein